jgi:hypothetical protein
MSRKQQQTQDKIQKQQQTQDRQRLPNFLLKLSDPSFPLPEGRQRGRRATTTTPLVRLRWRRPPEPSLQESRRRPPTASKLELLNPRTEPFEIPRTEQMKKENRTDLRRERSPGGARPSPGSRTSRGGEGASWRS